jgi:Na+/H+ antiporter NhaC
MGPMSRWVSLYQALAKASAKACGFSWNRLEIGAYWGSNRKARSVVNMIGAWVLAGSWASGTLPAARGSLGVHWWAPAGLLVSSHS